MRVSERSESIEPSATLSISARANELKSQGTDVVNFGAGEPDFPTPEPIKRAGIQAIEENYTRYTSASGAPELKDAVRGKLERDQDLQYTRDQISTGCGAKHVLFNALATILDPGDEVLLFAPYWVSYPNQIRFFGGIPRVINTHDSSFQPDLEAVRRQTGPNTRALILNSPTNPTGIVVPPEVIEDLAKFCVDQDLLLISDEIYEKFTYGDTPHVSPAQVSARVQEHTILVNGVSKAYAMTGWRIGYAAGPEPVIEKMNTLMSHSTSNPTSISQRAAIRALQSPDDDIASMVDTFEERRDLMLERLGNMPGIHCERPEGAFYAFPDASELIRGRPDLESDMDLASRLLDEAHIAVVPGSPFGAEGFLRLSYANATERIREGLDRLEDWLTG